MTKKIEENVFAAVLRYDSARSLFDSIVDMEGVAQVYPEYSTDIWKIRDDMLKILVKIAEAELDGVEKIKTQLEQAILKEEL